MHKMLQLYRRFAYNIFFPYITFFLLYVGFGYYFNLTNAFPFLPKPAILLLCFIIVAFIYAFVRHTGHAIYQARQISGVAAVILILTFLFLFAISGYGFVSSSMLLIEGPVVARDDVAAAMTTTQNLVNVTKSSLPPQDYESLRKNVDQLREQLDTEIMNISQGYCGIGPSAKDILDKLGRLVPNIRLIAGTDRDHGCENKRRLEDMKALYDRQISDGLETIATQPKYRVAERTALTASVTTLLEGDLGNLNALREKLNGLPSFIGSLNLYHETIRVIENANADYMKAFGQVSRFINLRDAGYPPRLQTTDLEQLGSGIQILNTLFSRLDRLTTYFYLAVAFFFDLFAAFAASAVFRAYEERGGGTPTNVGGSDVQYLWLPERHPLTPEGAKRSIEP